MASGGILGTCLVCEEFVWEDEDWEVAGNFIVHSKCLFPSRPDFGIKKANWRLKVSSDIRRETNKN
ncbi:MAG: hypothetical protein PWQ23_540 [Thermoanaerobacter sp.]|jgi:hypothetical protein|nr:hypothetical protein [Thermoanaerobacter sp.]